MSSGRGWVAAVSCQYIQFTCSLTHLSLDKMLAIFVFDFFILLNISLNFVPYGQKDKNPALV